MNRLITEAKYGGFKRSDLSMSETKDVIRLACVRLNTMADVERLVEIADAAQKSGVEVDQYYRRPKTTRLCGVHRTLLYIVARSELEPLHKRKALSMLFDPKRTFSFDINRPVTKEKGAGNLLVASLAVLQIRDLEWYRTLLDIPNINTHSKHKGRSVGEYIRRYLAAYDVVQKAATTRTDVVDPLRRHDKALLDMLSEHT